MKNDNNNNDYSIHSTSTTTTTTTTTTATVNTINNSSVNGQNNGVQATVYVRESDLDDVRKLNMMQNRLSDLITWKQSNIELNERQIKDLQELPKQILELQNQLSSRIGTGLNRSEYSGENYYKVEDDFPDTNDGLLNSTFNKFHPSEFKIEGEEFIDERLFYPKPVRREVYKKREISETKDEHDVEFLKILNDDQFMYISTKVQNDIQKYHQQTGAGIYHAQGKRSEQEDEDAVGVLPGWDDLNHEQKDKAACDAVKKLQDIYDAELKKEEKIIDFVIKEQEMWKEFFPEETYRPLETSGSTFIATIIDITDREITTISLGDSYSIAIKFDANYQVMNLAILNTKLHNPENESDRLTLDSDYEFRAYDDEEVDAGEEVEGVYRLLSGLAVSRAIGDKTSEPYGLIHVPDVYHNKFSLAEGETLYIASACDGLMENDCLTLNDIATLISENRDQTIDELAKIIVNEAIARGSLDNVSLVFKKVIFADLKNDKALPICLAIFDGHGGEQVSKNICGPHFFPSMSAAIEENSPNQKKEEDSDEEENETVFYIDFFINAISFGIKEYQAQLSERYMPTLERIKFYENLLMRVVRRNEKIVIIIALLTDAKVSKFHAFLNKLPIFNLVPVIKEKLKSTIQEILRLSYRKKNIEKVGVYLGELIDGLVGFQGEVNDDEVSRWLQNLRKLFSGSVEFNDKKSIDIDNVNKNDAVPQSQAILTNIWGEACRFEMISLEALSLDLQFISISGATNKTDLELFNIPNKSLPALIKRTYNKKTYYYFYGAINYKEYKIIPLKNASDLIESCEFHSIFKENATVQLSIKKDDYGDFFDCIREKRAHQQFGYSITVSNPGLGKKIQEYILSLKHIEFTQSDFYFDLNSKSSAIIFHENKENIFIEAVYYAVTMMVLEGIGESIKESMEESISDGGQHAKKDTTINNLKKMRNDCLVQISEGAISYDCASFATVNIQLAYARHCEKILRNDSISYCNKFNMICFLSSNNYVPILFQDIRNAVGFVFVEKSFQMITNNEERYEFFRLDFVFNEEISELMQFQMNTPMPDISIYSTYVGNALKALGQLLPKQGADTYSILSSIFTFAQEREYVDVFKELLQNRNLHPFEAHIIYAFLDHPNVELGIKNKISKEISGCLTVGEAKEFLMAQFKRGLLFLYPEHTEDKVKELDSIIQKIKNHMDALRSHSNADYKEWLNMLKGLGSTKYLAYSIAESPTIFRPLQPAYSSVTQGNINQKKGPDDDRSDGKNNDTDKETTDFTYEFEL